MLTALVHNDFHVQHGIFPIFNGLEIKNINAEPFKVTEAINGEPVENQKTSQHEAVTNGVHSILIKN